MFGPSVTVAGVGGPLVTVHKVVLAGGTWFGGSTGNRLLYTKCHCGRCEGPIGYCTQSVTVSVATCIAGGVAGPQVPGYCTQRAVRRL